MRLNPPLGFCPMSNFPPLDGSAPKKQKFDAAPEMGIDPSKRYTATMETSMGTLVIALDPIAAPITVNNFVFLAAQHYYDGIIFHRIIHNFMCQGGDPGGDGRGGPGYRFVDELPKPFRYVKGAVAMANSGPNTNGSQFFICSDDLVLTEKDPVTGKGPNYLVPDYSLFGQVVKGLDIIEMMHSVPTGPGNRPKDDVVIRSVTITVAD